MFKTNSAKILRQAIEKRLKAITKEESIEPNQIVIASNSYKQEIDDVYKEIIEASHQNLFEVNIQTKIHELNLDKIENHLKMEGFDVRRYYTRQEKPTLYFNVRW